MKKKGIILLALVLGAGFAQNLSAKEDIGPQRQVRNSDDNRRMTMFGSSCEPASASTDLDINNVRAKMLNGGDMWWDLNNPKYEVPKVTDPTAVRKHSLFSGALWIGGLGRGDGLLRLAAMTYRQRGSDFWPGPLDISTASTDPTRCKNYDKIWKITREELEEAKASNWVNIPTAMLDWPAGRARPQRESLSDGEPDQLAPYFEKPGVGVAGVYEPSLGEYPVLDPSRGASINTVSDQPDMFLWWVYNDKGNIHSETNGIPIGIEVQTTAFAYSSFDERNNMTFYSSTVVNRGNEALDKTYFGQWVDADLGNYADDYVGCDVGRSLGYCYNGDDDDEGILGYGQNPPSIGVDFFEGPRDTSGLELGMYAFMYYNNDANPINGNPDNANEFYNLLQGKWLGGQDVTFGGNGIGGAVKTRYMFPDDTDPAFAGQKWTERTSGNRPGDRRFIQSSGPFTMLPGAVNKVTVGVVWAKATSGGATGSLGLLKIASDKAQDLFNNKFVPLRGPAAPDVEAQELEGEVVLKLLNTENIERFKTTYITDSKIVPGKKDTLEYRFQGYMIYQLKDATVSNTDLTNIEKARLVYQCDIRDGVSQLINREYDFTTNDYVKVLKVDGENKGISHTFSIKKDMFATTANQNLVDYKPYYYVVLSYGYLGNDPAQVQLEQYLPGSDNIKPVKVIPHKTQPELGGNELGSYYGFGPKLKRIEGRGNGGNVLEFTKETIDEIIRNGSSANPVYMNGSGPVKIKVVDPIKVPKGDFELVFTEPPVQTKPSAQGWQDSIKDLTTWFLVNKTTGDTVFSDTTIAYKFETVQGRKGKNNPNKNATLADWGLSLEVEQVKNPGDNRVADVSNGYISYNITWQDIGKQWLTALVDNDNPANANYYFQNWIRSGKRGSLTSINTYTDDNSDGSSFLDPNESFEKIWNGRIAPYALAAREDFDGNSGSNTFGPAWANSGNIDNPMRELASFDLVITPDKSKWTECVVLEGGDDQNKSLNEGQMSKLNLRWGTSKDKDGNPVNGSRGKSWFPGYAVNLETGERLNIAFSEDSWLGGDNGNDMLWNPTSTYFRDGSTYPALGGRHFIYVFGGSSAYSGSPRTAKGTSYDGGNSYANDLAVTTPGSSPSLSVKRRVLSQVMWVIPTYLAAGYKMDNGVPPTEVKISVRVKKAYNAFQPAGTTPKNNGRPMYEFNTQDIAPQVNLENGKKALDMAAVVPNPYRAFSKYETSPIDSRVKIINLPPKCEVKIYTMSGILVRKVAKDDERTYIEWDLKNDANVPITSGLYLIHIDAGELGEKVIRWYGVMKTLDLDTF